MQRDVPEILRSHGIQPSAQRVAVGKHILFTDSHPSADEVWRRVQEGFPMISRATVYNTLHLFAEKGLLQELHLTEGRVVFDPNTDRHHHFIDEDTGRMFDLPWEAVQISGVEQLDGYEVRTYQVVACGKKK